MNPIPMVVTWDANTLPGKEGQVVKKIPSPSDTPTVVFPSGIGQVPPPGLGAFPRKFMPVAGVMEPVVLVLSDNGKVFLAYPLKQIRVEEQRGLYFILRLMLDMTEQREAMVEPTSLSEVTAYEEDGALHIIVKQLP